MNTNFADDSAFPEGPHPLTAALLSMIPGLGQLYVGERRKGVLFLNVAVINTLLLGLCLFAYQLSQNLLQFASSHHMRMNEKTAIVLQHLNFGSPASIMVILLVLAFAVYCARDAYDHAFLQRRKQIYKDFILELSEASSVSYLTHFALIVCFAMMAIFLIMPAPKVLQSVHVYVLTDNPPVKQHEKSVNMANTNAQLSGRRTDTGERPRVNTAQPTHRTVTPTHATARPAAPAHQQPAPAHEQPAPAHQQPVPAHEQPAPAHPQPAPRVVPHPVDVPRPVAPMPMSALPQVAPAASSILQPRAISAAAPVPTPNAAGARVASSANLLAMMAPTATHGTPVGGTIAPMPNAGLAGGPRGAGMPEVGAARIGATNPRGIGIPGLPSHVGPGISGTSGQPAPVAAGTPNSTGTGAPNVVSVGKGPGRNPSASTDEGPTPIRPNGSDTKAKGPGFAVAPKLVDAGPGVHAPTDSPTAATPKTEKVIDWSVYMAELQRRIRKHWFPPHDPSSRLAVVTFSVNTDGSLHNLRLTQSTGIESSDRAAIAAVESSAPFHGLPEGAPSSVDIEFTFSYQVWQQNGSGIRRF